MSNECKGIFGAIFGHNYQARYSKGRPALEKCDYFFTDEVVKLIDASKPSTYECDICTRCGDIINKKNKAED